MTRDDLESDLRIALDLLATYRGLMDGTAVRPLLAEECDLIARHDLDTRSAHGHAEAVNERLQGAFAAANELQRVALAAMNARPGRFHNREGYAVRDALMAYSTARAFVDEPQPEEVRCVTCCGTGVIRPTDPMQADYDCPACAGREGDEP